MRDCRNVKCLLYVAGPLCAVALAAAFSVFAMQWPSRAVAAPATDVKPLEMVADHGVQLDSAGKIDLKILYAAKPGAARTRDFTSFLRMHFGKVKLTDLKGFKERLADGYDVTIVDYDGDGFKAPRPAISESFSKPLVTVGVPGGLMCSNWGLKTGYL